MAEQTFSYFPLLPRELRDKIWSRASCIPRYVDVNTTPHESCPPGSHAPVSFRYFSNTRTPSILHVCKDSRAEGLRHYDLDFSSASCNSSDEPSSGTLSCFGPRIYINWAVDCVVILGDNDLSNQQWSNKNYSEIERLNERALEHFITRCEEGRLRRLAVNISQRDYSYLQPGRFTANWLLPAPRSMTELMLFDPWLEWGSRRRYRDSTKQITRFIDIERGSEEGAAQMEKLEFWRGKGLDWGLTVRTMWNAKGGESGSQDLQVRFGCITFDGPDVPVAE